MATASVAIGSVSLAMPRATVLVFGNARGGTPLMLNSQQGISAFNDRLQAEGHWVFAGGLGRPARPP
jgi:hypothetical protein